MKKIFAALLSICLLLSAVAAYADSTAEPGLTNLTWESVQEEASAIEGETVNIPDTPYSIFLPAGFRDRGVTEDQIQKGLLLNREWEALNVTLKCQKMPLDITSFLATYSNEEALAFGESCTINGREAYCLGFTGNPGSIQFHILVQADEGYTLQLIIDGYQFQPELPLVIIMSSIR